MPRTPGASALERVVQEPRHLPAQKRQRYLPLSYILTRNTAADSLGSTQRHVQVTRVDAPCLHLGLRGEAVAANHVQRHQGGEALDEVLNALVRDLHKGCRQTLVRVGVMPGPPPERGRRPISYLITDCVGGTCPTLKAGAGPT